MAQRKPQKRAGSDTGIDLMEIEIQSINTDVVIVPVVGTSPLLVHSMSRKARGELALPAPKGARKKSGAPKHVPISEFRECLYLSRRPESPTLLTFPTTAFKGAMLEAALRVGGSSKREIGQLVLVEGAEVHLYGVPKVHVGIVRNSDINKTPDVRTRAVLEQWGAEVRIRYIKPKLNEKAVLTLFAAAGLIMGVGDFRPEKGKGSFGQFRLAEPDDAEWAWLREHAGRKQQQDAYDDPQPFDEVAAEMLEWVDSELRRRGQENAA